MLLGRACRKMFIHNKPLRLSSKNKGEKQSQSNMNKAITSRCHLAISLFRDHFKTVLPVQYTENDNGNILCCAHWWLLWWGFNCEVAFKKLTKLTISFSLSLLSFRKLLLFFFFFPKSLLTLIQSFLPQTLNRMERFYPADVKTIRSYDISSGGFGSGHWHVGNCYPFSVLREQFKYAQILLWYGII